MKANDFTWVLLSREDLNLDTDLQNTEIFAICPAEYIQSNGRPMIEISQSEELKRVVGRKFDGLIEISNGLFVGKNIDTTKIKENLKFWGIVEGNEDVIEAWRDEFYHQTPEINFNQLKMKTNKNNYLNEEELTISDETFVPIKSPPKHFD